MLRLNDDLREELKDQLCDDRMCGMFGDGLEKEYIYEGTTIVGLNHMNDEELVEEYSWYADKDDELLVKCKIELSIEKVLSE